MVNAEDLSAVRSSRRANILDAAITVFGRLGFRKTSLEDLTQAAQISKQGLYLHFSSKEEVFLAALQKYLDDGLRLVDDALGRPDTSLFERLGDALDAWFGRHLVTFAPEALDVIEAGNRLSATGTNEYVLAFQTRLTKAIAGSAEFKRSRNVGSAKEMTEVLFLCGLSWKEGRLSRLEFRNRLNLCIRVCCQVKS
jgi:TetR/AcrR family transcriptional regulator, regulator of autoinduction and epiphytic fitness